MEKSYKPVVYRRFNRLRGTWPEADLETLCVMALNRRNASGDLIRNEWTARRFPCWTATDHYRFTHGLVYGEGSLFGMLCLYSPNEYQAIIREQREAALSEEGSPSPSSTLVEVAEREPPVGENYLKGHAYFLIRGNHLFAVQHQSVRTDNLQEYLHDLLRAGDTVPAENVFELQAVLRMPEGGGDIGDVVAVEIGGVPAAPPPRPAEPESALVVREVEERRDLGTARSGRSTGLKILDLLLGSVRADEIMETVPPEAELEVDVRFGFRSRRRKLSRAAMSEIASAARDMPEGQVRAIGKDGKAIGGDLRLQTDMPFRRLRHNGTLLELEHAREQLLKVYHRFVEDGKIPA